MKQMRNESSSHSHHAGFPFISVAIIGIFATIFLLVFYYIFVVKCCRNWRRIDVPTTDHHHTEPTGLHESVIRSIPIFHFRKQNRSDNSNNNNNNECAVCLAEFQDDEKLRMIPNCGHVFHIDCIDVWLQNNPNCPLCRNSVSVSMPYSYNIIPAEPAPRNDYVVIELDGGDDVGVGEGRGQNPNQPVAGKLTDKLRKRYGYDLSMGDECIGVNSRRKGDDRFVIQPIRRSFSMDSASDPQLYLAVQEIRNSLNYIYIDVTEVNDDSSSSSNRRLKKGFFSFGHTRSAISPFHIK